ncbi:hypothetical protein Ga0466249_000359 [Sporomusaceae bacterium BoRhaA]|nr:hypothetical protein [Pelorhabdus rhamnosifermentans]
MKIISFALSTSMYRDFYADRFRYDALSQVKSFIMLENESAKIEESMGMITEITRHVVLASIKNAALDAKKGAVSAAMSIRIF